VIASKHQPIDPRFVNNTVKTQYVRLIDVFVLGPAMIAAAVALPQRPVLRAILAVSGVGTIWYNARNYVTVQQSIQQDPSGQYQTAAWRRLP